MKLLLGSIVFLAIFTGCGGDETSSSNDGTTAIGSTDVAPIATPDRVSVTGE